MTGAAALLRAWKVRLDYESHTGVGIRILGHTKFIFLICLTF